MKFVLSTKKMLFTLVAIVGLIAPMIAMDVPQADLNEQLFKAVMQGNAQLAKESLTAGANVNTRAEGDKTALMYAATYGNTEACKLLIENGAHVNLQDELGGTALMDAAIRGHANTCQLLIENGAHINMQNNGGITALMVAAFNGSIETCKLLIKNGAQANMQDPYGNTALVKTARQAYRFGKVETSKLLINAMLEAPIDQAILDQIRLTEKQKNEVAKVLSAMKRSRVINKDLHKLVARNLVAAFKRRNMIETQINRMRMWHGEAKEQKIKQDLLDYLNEQMPQQRAPEQFQQQQAPQQIHPGWPDLRPGASARQVLGLPNTASIAEAKKAYYKLSRIYHPDKFDQNKAILAERGITRKEQATAAFQKISDAWERLQPPK